MNRMSPEAHAALSKRYSGEFIDGLAHATALVGHRFNALCDMHGRTDPVSGEMTFESAEMGYAALEVGELWSLLERLRKVLKQMEAAR